MKLEEVKVGLRVMVPYERLTEGCPWQECYGTVIQHDSFFGTPEILVRLDGDSARVIRCKLEELDYE